MSEKSEGPEASAPGVNPAALSIALGVSSSAKADAFLDEQTRLLRLQAEELSHEIGLRHWSLLVRHVSSVLKLVLEIGLAVAGLGIACFIAAAIWNAAHSDGLVIETFAVPPDMAAKGLSGQVIASQTLDKLTIIISNTDRSVRAAKSYSSNWGDDLKVEIPDTGVSMGEAYRFLKTWLGHETHISGELYRTATGIALTARLSGQPAVTVTGAEADLNSLTQKIAENIAAQTQPYRYAVFLRQQSRFDEATAAFKKLSAIGPAEERAWGFIGWGVSVVPTEGSGAEAALDEKALALQPDNPLALSNLSGGRSRQGRWEEALRLNNKALDALSGESRKLVNPGRLPSFLLGVRSSDASFKGDFREAAQEQAGSIAAGTNNNISPSISLAFLQARGHDLAAARDTIAHPLDIQGAFLGSNASAITFTQITIDAEAEDWAGLVSEGEKLPALFARDPGLRADYLAGVLPMMALARAKTGKFAAAEALIAPTPADCYPCLIQRAQIASLQGQHARADWWFARAVSIGPSLPFAEFEWGKVWLAHGKPDAAIAQFKLSNQKGPHFADPLEGWGEALMAKNQSHLALTKFKEAEKYAPNWGRLHLKWGEALVYAGKKDEAAKQFARAAQLDLTPSEKAELARHP